MTSDAITSPLLYKYRVADGYSLDLLKGDLYFAKHEQLNDPTDLNLGRSAERQYQARVASLEEEIEKLKEEARAYQKIYDEMSEMYYYLQNEADDMPPEEWLQEIASEKIAEIDRLTHQPPHRGHPKTLKSLANTFRKKLEGITLQVQNLESLKRTWENWQQANPPDAFTTRTSVLCLTTDKENYRMWTAYAAGFRGVCIGFDRNLLTEALRYSGCDIDGPIRVTYRKITIDVLLTPRFYLRKDNHYRYKPTHWRTEKEVRFVRRDGFGIVNVPLSCVKEIILGEGLDSQFRRTITDEILYGLLGAATDSDELAVYQAAGDSEGRVHIEPEAYLSSRISQLREEMNESLYPEIKTPEENNPRTEDIPPDDDIPF